MAGAMNTEQTIQPDDIGFPPVGDQDRPKPAVALVKVDRVQASVHRADSTAPSPRKAYLSARHHAGFPAAEVLPRRFFLQQLQREKRRAERSNLALSVAEFWLESPSGAIQGGEQRLLSLLLSVTRETDIVGSLGRGRVAVILTDTGADGAIAFRQKVAERASGLYMASLARTYPDSLFEELCSTDRPKADTDPLLLDARRPAQRLPFALKRCLDVVGASTAIVLFSPIMAMAAVAIAATSPGPIVFRQVRVGRHGVPFSFYKFRSMYANSDDRIHREYVTSIIKKSPQADSDKQKAWSKLEHDPRITPVGRFFRKTSIDELPQLFNVLQGHLSLVGPRPPLPYEAAEYESWHLRRVLEVKPGITGLWQADGRGATTFEDMVRLDLHYVKNWSLLLDIKILFKTVLVVIRRQGAS